MSTTTRETREIKIENHTFVVNAYATGREVRAIQQTYFKGAKIEVVGQEPKISDFNPGVQFEVHAEMIRQMVLTMDGSEADIVDRCMDEVPSDVLDELITRLDDLVSKKKEIGEAVMHYSMGRANTLMQIVTICEKFGWTYEEYLNQPSFFITLIKEKWVRDQKEQDMELKKMNHGK